MLEDAQIIALYLKRDEAAISHTAEQYGSRLRRLAYGIVSEQSTAEECENDTYLEAWQSIPPHEPYTYFYAFLARITRHISLNCCRIRDCLKQWAQLCELDAEMEQCIRRLRMELRVSTLVPVMATGKPKTARSRLFRKKRKTCS